MSSQTILAIDPGPDESAFIEWDGETIGHFGKYNNETLRLKLLSADYLTVVVEQIAAMGMSVGEEVFQTVFWSGVFAECSRRMPFDRMKRHEVKMHLCGNMRAKDANIRQSLLDRFGPGKEKAIGKKNSPGPCYGISADVWQALALAVTYYDKKIKGT